MFATTIGDAPPSEQFLQPNRTRPSEAPHRRDVPEFDEMDFLVGTRCATTMRSADAIRNGFRFMLTRRSTALCFAKILSARLAD
jgi:hypothetical protein